MTDGNSSFEQVRQLADEQRKIYASMPYVWYLDDSPPGSPILWPNNRLPYALAELDSCLSQSTRSDPTNPYTQYDEHLLPLCGPDGYARAGDVIGIRDQGKALEFLGWIRPDDDERDTKVNLALMMSKLMFGEFQQAVRTIGDSLIHQLSAIHIAALAVRISDSWFEVRKATELEHSDEN